MAVTGTDVFTVTRDQIITATLRLLGVIGVGETPITEDYTNCSQALNIMIKSWAKKGFPLWVYQDVAIPMVENVTVYPLGPTAAYVNSVTVSSGGTNYPDTGTVTFTGGTTGTVATGTYTASGGVIQSVTMTANGDSYTSAPTVSFSTGGTGSGATGTAVLVGLTIPRPLRIIQAFRRDQNNFDTILIQISRQEYDILGSKFSLGIPNQYYYDAQLENGQLYVYNDPVDDSNTIHAQIQRQFYDMTSGTDNFDFPQEFFQALKWGLAAELLAEYGVPLNMIPYYEQKAQMYIEECFDWSQEDAGIFFSPNPQGTIRKTP